MNPSPTLARRPRLAFILATTLVLATVTGCKPDAALRKAETLDKPSTSAVPVANAGTITGTVTFTGKPPARIPIDMSMDPVCSLAAQQNLSEPYVIANGKLANVYIYVKAGAPPSTAPAGTAPVVLDQKGCRYLPHVIAVQQGGTVAFHNSDPTMHNIHTTPTDGSPSIDVSQGPLGQPQTRTFDTPELMLPVRCNNHPWMEAFINVSPTPYFAVTGPDGKFTLRGLPPGHYTLAAVHEKLGEQDLDITVPPNASAPATFTFAAK